MTTPTERRKELLKTIQSYLLGPRPNGDMAQDCFDREFDGLLNELDEVEGELRDSN